MHLHLRRRGGKPAGKRQCRKKRCLGESAFGRQGGRLHAENANSSREQVLGSDKAMQRTPYADSPIVKAIKAHCLRIPGKVFIIYAPSNVGKTTACHAILDKYARKGLAFLPPDVQGTYTHVMLARLGLDPNKPPNGWLRELFKKLHRPYDGRGPGILFLDDFMNENANDGSDLDLLKSMKTLAKEMNVAVIVLTKNEGSANIMITQNDMASIIPAVAPDVAEKLRVTFLNWNHQKVAGTKQGLFRIDWNLHIPMRWETDELKKAVLAHPEHVRKDNDEKRLLATEMDDIINRMDPDQREMTVPSSLLSSLVRLGSAPTLTPTKKGFFDWDSLKNCCGG